MPFNSHLSAVLDKSCMKDTLPPTRSCSPLPKRPGPGWAMIRAETHLSIIPGAGADPVLVPLIDEAIIIHDIFLPLGFTLQVDSILWGSKWKEQAEKSQHPSHSSPTPEGPRPWDLISGKRAGLTPRDGCVRGRPIPTTHQHQQ